MVLEYQLQNMLNRLRPPHAFHGIFISEYAPVIEANCYIGAGAKIIGPCHIGTDVRIGANAIVVDDIPDHATVVLQKPRIIVR